MIVFAAFIFLSTLTITTYAAIGPIGVLPIVNAHISPDGFRRSSVLAGGTFPGPLIQANKVYDAQQSKGDTFAIDVVDSLTDSTMLRSTSIHWHGIFQEGTNWEDGAASVTQCPIIPGHSFLYNFKAPDQAGTYWYHSHLSTQYCDGLRGPLVIYDPNDPQKHLYDIDDESTIITLSDWYHNPSPQLPTFPVFNSTLINGLGRYAGGPASPLAVIDVAQKKRYRFRLISMACDPSWIFSIDNHLLTIIEVDGVAHQPLTVDSIQIFAGQRYSFVLTANQKVDNYWVRAVPEVLGSNQGFVNGTAILRYAGAGVADPTTNSVGTLPLVETALRPLVNTPVPGQPYPGGADVVLNLPITLTPNFTYAINGTSFVPPTAPVLLQILSGTQAAQDLLPQGSVIELPPNKAIEISIPGGSPGSPHPFHLHGHNFHIIRSAGNSTYNFVNPVIRDVVTTGLLPTDLTTFRFVTDNAGPWFLHCHVDWHLEVGLAVVFAENVPKVAQEKPPAAWDSLCPLYNASPKDRRDD
ncbi:Laccase I [Mycena sanguinolenta]|uniref:Laccase I n=1 Tax=Mycena sanguinolenta TaxID=230812 RepID=A0A8H6YQB2_9AGAR|nr:Laccase I [Mycena sanguinolenta]